MFHTYTVLVVRLTFVLILNNVVICYTHGCIYNIYLFNLDKYNARNLFLKFILHINTHSILFDSFKLHETVRH